MTKNEINTYIHTKILGNVCWHTPELQLCHEAENWKKAKNCGDKHYYCSSCGWYIPDYDEGSPDYYSGSSPRNLLNEVVDKVWDECKLRNTIGLQPNQNWNDSAEYIAMQCVLVWKATQQTK